MAHQYLNIGSPFAGYATSDTNIEGTQVLPSSSSNGLTLLGDLSGKTAAIPQEQADAFQEIKAFIERAQPQELAELECALMLQDGASDIGGTFEVSKPWQSNIKNQLYLPFHSHAGMLYVMKNSLKPEEKKHYQQLKENAHLERENTKFFYEQLRTNPNNEAILKPLIIYLMERNGEHYSFKQAQNYLNKIVPSSYQLIYSGDYFLSLFFEENLENYFALTLADKTNEPYLSKLATQQTPEGVNALFWFMHYLCRQNKVGNLASKLNNNYRDIQCPFEGALSRAGHQWTEFKVKKLLNVYPYPFLYLQTESNTLDISDTLSHQDSTIKHAGDLLWPNGVKLCSDEMPFYDEESFFEYIRNQLHKKKEFPLYRRLCLQDPDLLDSIKNELRRGERKNLKVFAAYLMAFKNQDARFSKVALEVSQIIIPPKKGIKYQSVVHASDIRKLFFSDSGFDFFCLCQINPACKKDMLKLAQENSDQGRDVLYWFVRLLQKEGKDYQTIAHRLNSKTNLICPISGNQTLHGHTWTANQVATLLHLKHVPAQRAPHQAHIPPVSLGKPPFPAHFSTAYDELSDEECSEIAQRSPHQTYIPPVSIGKPPLPEHFSTAYDESSDEECSQVDEIPSIAMNTSNNSAEIAKWPNGVDRHMKLLFHDRDGLIKYLESKLDNVEKQYLQQIKPLAGGEKLLCDLLHPLKENPNNSQCLKPLVIYMMKHRKCMQTFGQASSAINHAMAGRSPYQGIYNTKSLVRLFFEDTAQAYYSLTNLDSAHKYSLVELANQPTKEGNNALYWFLKYKAGKVRELDKLPGRLNVHYPNLRCPISAETDKSSESDKSGNGPRRGSRWTIAKLNAALSCSTELATRKKRSLENAPMPRQRRAHLD